MVDAGLAVRGVEEHIGVARHAEITSTERGHFPVEIGANPGYFGLGDAGVGGKGFDQVVNFPRRDAVEVSLPYDGEQGLVNTSATLEESGKERPLPQLGDLEIQVAGRRREDARAGAVALVGAVLGAFETAGADVRGGLGVDEFLVERFGHRSDSVGDVGELEFREEREQGRLV
ncbi:hypothetical protein BJ997_003956 [Cryobacterium roopkundense]|uniref:Uncharacterized protein n=1 Tax=Cryobacterium roopkundense TaxID=1001240 RepID=A0A7W9A0I0_9MICO|nr:hypothetical protein [Cryobacterium roopkundense]